MGQRAGPSPEITYRRPNRKLPARSSWTADHGHGDTPGAATPSTGFAPAAKRLSVPPGVPSPLPARAKPRGRLIVAWGAQPTAASSPPGVSPTVRKKRRAHARRHDFWKAPAMSPGVATISDGRLEVHRRKLPRALAKYIDRNGPWHWFTTHTMTADVTPARAVRLFEAWIARLNAACSAPARNSRKRARVATGSAKRNGVTSAPASSKAPDSGVDRKGQSAGRTKPVVSYVLAVEWTQAGRVHLHAAVSFAVFASHQSRGSDWEALSRKDWCDRWERMTHRCGMARIYLQRGRASSYLAKELGKGGVFILGGPFARRLTAYQSARRRSSVAPNGAPESVGATGTVVPRQPRAVTRRPDRHAP